MEVLELIRELEKNLKITIVMVLHDMNFTARYSDPVSYTHLLFAPTELAIGTVTAAFGAPVVIYMMVKRRKMQQA